MDDLFDIVSADGETTAFGDIAPDSAGQSADATASAVGDDDVMASFLEGFADFGKKQQAQPAAPQYVAPQNPVQGQPSQAQPSTPVAPAAPPAMSEMEAEIVALMYVEFLDSMLQSVGAAVSKATGDYGIGTRLKKGYREITAAYIRSGNIQVTPAEMFGIATICVLISSGSKVWKDYNKTKKKEKAESAKQEAVSKKIALVQQGAFDGTDKIMEFRETDWRMDLARAKFQTENDFYIYDKAGVYVKKDERSERPSDVVKEAFRNGHTKAPDIKQFIKDKYQKNG